MSDCAFAVCGVPGSWMGGHGDEIWVIRDIGIWDEGGGRQLNFRSSITLLMNSNDFVSNSLEQILHKQPIFLKRMWNCLVADYLLKGSK